MGLCKCPKRRVTNQFCYEHRVNVCEYCLVSNHQKCVVLSYLQWLQDSDYNPICELCGDRLESKECVRLTCYHVFHWDCLNTLCSRYPPTTAPAGYVCPACHASIFPSSKLVSPVADVLREKLKQVEWGKAAIVFDSDHNLEEAGSIAPSYRVSYTNEQKPDLIPEQDILGQSSFSRISTDDPTRDDAGSSHGRRTERELPISVKDDALIFMEEPIVVMDKRSQGPRRLAHSFGDPEPEYRSSRFNDHDDDKYHRRNPTERLKTHWNLWSSSNNQSVRYFRGKRLYIILAVAAFVFILWLIRIWDTIVISENDPLFDPLLNPNVHVEDGN